VPFRARLVRNNRIHAIRSTHPMNRVTTNLPQPECASLLELEQLKLIRTHVERVISVPPDHWDINRSKIPTQVGSRTVYGSAVNAR